jgi:uncharacterized protein affecting Mg2+/Co2+ transport
MSIFDPIYDRVAEAISGRLGGDKDAIQRRKYYVGDQKPPLRVLPNKADDNVLINFVGLVVDRSISHVLSGGVVFDLPDLEVIDQNGKATKQDTDQQKYIDALYELNKQNMLLLNAVINGGVYGTGYIKIKPDGLTDPYTEETYPRLIALNPEYLTIETDPQDQERVIAYIVQYKVGNIVYRETTRLANRNDFFLDEDGNSQPVPTETWVIVNEVSIDDGHSWITKDMQNFPYPFPNIIHWKNLPSLNSIYGSSDIDDVLGMQDKSNFVNSNIQKQVRLQSHKQPWGRGVTKADNLNVGADSMIQLNGANAEIGVMDFQTDISGSLQFERDLRQSLFDVAREVDITSITDKIGALTNFGLRVLYSDSLAKNDTKRQLIGEALLELNRRLLVMKGYEGEDTRPGEIKWKDPLPVNILEKLQAQTAELDNGTVDKQTIAEENNRDWKVVKERLQEEKVAGDGLIGSAIMRAFPNIAPTEKPLPK